MFEQLTVLDSFKRLPKFKVDIYDSLIWVERYFDAGEFELTLPLENPIPLYMFETDSFLIKAGSNTIMVIEDKSIESSIEGENQVIIRGRSAPSILDRRIVWVQTLFDNWRLERAVEQLMNDNLVNPTDTNRKINKFTCQDYTLSSIYPLDLRVTTQFTGVNLYDAIRKLCYNAKVGFKVVMNSYTRNFELQLYKGIENRGVIFSQENGNIANINYMEASSIYKNVALVGGEGEGLDRVYYTSVLDPSLGPFEDLDRREMFVDARDLSSEKDDGTFLSDEDYGKLLNQRGIDKLLEMKVIKTLEGEAISVRKSEPFIDYNLGDVIQVYSPIVDYRVSQRVIEITTSINKSGIAVYPTFAEDEKTTLDLSDNQGLVDNI